MALNRRLLNYCYIKNFPFINNYTVLNNRRYAQIKCWKCGVEKKSVLELFCDQCNVIQSPQEGSNYFKVLGFSDSYDINSKELQQKYRQMQSVLHPDKFSTR